MADSQPGSSRRTRKKRRVQRYGSVPSLDASEQIQFSIRREQALIVRAKREREQVAVERDHFELTKDKIAFGFELLLAVIAVVAVLIVLVANPDLIPGSLLGGGILGGGIGLLRSREGR